MARSEVRTVLENELLELDHYLVGKLALAS